MSGKQKTIADYFSRKRPYPEGESSETQESSASAQTSRTDDDNVEDSESDTESEKNFGDHLKVSKPRRNYNKTWETDYKWLYYDELRGGAFCKICEQFGKNNMQTKQKSGGVFVHIPFTNYKNALGSRGKLEKHQNSNSHLKYKSMYAAQEASKRNPLPNQLLVASQEEIRKNRRSLSLLLRGLYFLAKNEIAHTTKYEKLVKNLITECNEELNTWIFSQSNRNTYVSKATASELLSCIGQTLDDNFAQSMADVKFSIMADESTNIKNVCELSICVRYVRDSKPVETFLSIQPLTDTRAETISSVIQAEMHRRNLLFGNLVAFGFDGASNMSGNIGGVRKILSTKAGRDIPYIHCRAHILALAVTSARNKFPKIKRVLHVVKDIYKLFHQSPKREHILHSIQEILNDPKLKIPEAVDVRWFSHYKVVHAVKVSYVAIMMACEHIHKDGGDLSSLAGGILLDLQNESFLISLCGLDEALSAVVNLSTTLQCSTLSLTDLPNLIMTSITHLQNLSTSLLNDHEDRNPIVESANELAGKIKNVRFNADREMKQTLQSMKKFIDEIIKEMRYRFNDKAIELINTCAMFQSFDSVLNISDDKDNIRVIHNALAQYHNIDFEELRCDIKSFQYYVKRQQNEAGSPLTKPLEHILGAYSRVEWNSDSTVELIPYSFHCPQKKLFLSLDGIRFPMEKR